MNFRYSYKKNSQLLQTRGIGFEEIIQAITEGCVLDIKKHPNEIQYPNQNILYVRILKEVYAVPFVEETNNYIFLKTLFPTRKARKEFLGK
jgi:maltose-binding protein MalE